MRELSADRAKASGDEWKLVIDFPFDVESAGRSDDEAQIEKLKSDIESRTIFWLPAFITRSVQRDIGLLVTISGLLAGDRLTAHAAHLSVAEREKARQLLESQKSQLDTTVKDALAQAYGLANPKPETIEGQEKPVFASLDPALDDIRPPVGSDLRTAVDSLCDQLLRRQFPNHPEFGERITGPKLRKVWGLVQRAAENHGGRLDDLERGDRVLLKNIAEPLELGEMHEGPFVLSTAWRERFVKARASADIEILTVRHLGEWIEQPDARGLTQELQDLVILTYAAQGNLSFELHGGPYAPKGPGDVSQELKLKEIELPSQDEWDTAANTASALFGEAIPSLPTAQNLARYGDSIRTRAVDVKDDASKLLAALEGTLTPTLGLSHDSPRARASREAAELAEALTAGDGPDSLRLLVTLEPSCTPQELGRTLARADAAGRAIREANWEIIGRGVEMARDGDARAQDALKQLEEAATRTEMEVSLEPALDAAEGAFTAIIVERPVELPPPLDPSGKALRDLSVSDARKALDELENPDDAIVDLAIRTRTPEPR